MFFLDAVLAPAIAVDRVRYYNAINDGNTLYRVYTLTFII